MSLFPFLVRRRQTIAVVGLVVLALCAQVQVIHDMVAVRPYEYMYFSPLVGGVPGATGKYDMDYWGVCNKLSAEWLERRSRNRKEEIDKKSWGWLAQENHTSQEEKD